MTRSWLVAAAGGAALVGALLISMPSVAVVGQAACVDEREPNDTAIDLGAGVPTEGAICVTGTLPQDDQDLALWDLSEHDARSSWTLTVDGVPGVLTTLKVFGIISDPGVVPVEAGGVATELDVQPSDASEASGGLLFAPGRYLIGIARSDPPDGDQPDPPGYRFSLEPVALPEAPEQEPNDSPDDATQVSGALDIGGDLAGSVDYYRWTVPEQDVEVAWEFHGRGVLGTLLSLHIAGPDGEGFLDVDSDLQGRLDVYDLRVPPGVYHFYVWGGRDAPSPYRLTARSGPTVGDPEPNDLIEHAVPLAPDVHLVTGRLVTDGDRDHYRLTFPDDASPVLRDIRLISLTGLQRELCLLTPEGQQLQCRAGTEGVALRNLLLGPGDHILRIGGDASMDLGYALRIDESVAPPPDFEAEPNDTMDLATPFDASLVMHARGGPDDRDHYRMRVSGGAGLWDVAVTGVGITALDWHRADNTLLASAEVSTDGTSAELRDMYLVPGDHLFTVDATSGDYQLKATYTGPLDPLAEREPNDDDLAANAYRIGTTRSGRLASDREVDVYRFALSATEHLRMSVEPPANGSVTLELDRDGRRIAGRGPPGMGESTSYEAELPAGDYEVVLRPGTPSDGRYAFAVERLDPFVARDDMEPNDDEWAARPMPTSGFVRGSGALPSDQDWFVLPASADGTPITVVLEGEDARPMMSDWVSTIPLTAAEDGRTWTSDPVPMDVPLFLGVESGGDGPYTLTLAGGAEPAHVGDVPFDITLDATEPAVAAYWPEAQRVSVMLHVRPVTPGSNGASQLTIDARTSNEDWLVELGAATVTLDGTDVESPIVIQVPADAWADDPVRVTVRARDPEGRSATASVDIKPDRAAPPVAPEQAWSVPEPLRGGLDVAATALGATLLDPVDPDLEAQLHDGTAHSGVGWYLPRDSWTLPVTLTVDLAGDAPIPIAGTIIDPRAQAGSTDQVPRRFELLLSADGSTWTSVLDGALSPRMTDQSFVLGTPVEARFAQLRLLSSWATRGSELALGEWKVIAVPGTPTASAALDIADPALGGHISWMDPQDGDELFWRGLLDEEPTMQQMPLDAGTHLTWAVGFRDDRAAQVTELQWVDPAGTDPKQRFRQVDVAVSMLGPAGPWRELGTWKLERAADGSVSSFLLPEPTWARFLRYTGDAPRKDSFYWAMPATLRVIEAPTGPTYRSVVGEWGALRPVGPYESLQPPPVISVPPDEAGQNDTRETAQPLTPGVTTAGRVARGEDVDWYTVEVPEGDNTLAVDLRGAPILAASVTLFDSGGLEVPVVVAPGNDQATLVTSAQVDPGRYWMRVEQPVSSVVIAFDTSASMADYFGYVFEGIRSFTADVAAGQESVLVVPFEEQPLLPEWSDQAYELENAVNQFVLDGLSSGLEAAIIDGSRELSARPGARAILVLTDAETSTYRLSAEMWRTLAGVRPLVFSAQVGAPGQPLLSEQYLQDLAAVAGGFHQYARSHAELDRAFDRLATWLRRPAAYELRTSTSFREVPPETRSPGSIGVVAPPDGTGTSTTPIGKDVGVEIILDTSGSMLKKIGGVRRIDAAKRVLTELVSERLPAGTPVAVRVLGSKDDVCGTHLVTALGPLDPAAVISNVDAIKVDQESDTPLGAALRAVPLDLAGSTGTRIVLLITDSEEVWPHPDLCGDDPAAAIRELRRRGIDARLNIVGLQVDARKAKAQLRRWARIGNGSFFEARDGAQLGRSIRAAVSAPFRILDANGNEVASGTVGGDPVPVPPGTYSVVVLRDPVARFDHVVVKPKGKVMLTLEASETHVPSEGTVPDGSPTDQSP